MEHLSTATVALVTAAGTLLLCGGIALLRLSWLGKRPRNLPYLVGGWLLVVAGLAAFDYAWDAEVGMTYGLIALSLVAYLIIAAGVENRAHKWPKLLREIADEPEERATKWPRAVAKALLPSVSAWPLPSPCRWERTTASSSAACSCRSCGAPGWPGP
jgi:hypothetical protein